MRFNLGYINNKTSRKRVLNQINELIIFLELNSEDQQARRIAKELEQLEKSVTKRSFKIIKCA
ncbi:hypothetical protein D3C86_1874540 [compost metagenome]